LYEWIGICVILKSQTKTQPSINVSAAKTARNFQLARTGVLADSNIGKIIRRQTIISAFFDTLRFQMAQHLSASTVSST
jgi:hypothetical protein